MIKLKYFTLITILFVGCLTPVDKSRKEATALLDAQHQVLIDFIHWDKTHQLDIVRAAKNKEEAKNHLITYRKNRDELIEKLMNLLGDEYPDTLLELADPQKSFEIVVKMRRQLESVRQKISEFERADK